MAAASTYMTSTNFSSLSKFTITAKNQSRKLKGFSISAQNAKVEQEEELKLEGKEINQVEEQKQAIGKTPRPVEAQVNVETKGLSREYGGQWLSCTTRHVRIYAAYIDMETCAMDQSQMDKLTLLLDPTDEFLWTDDTCHKVYSYFQELVDHYEGAPLTEYTLRLIGSDIEHYIRKLLFKGEIQYNMDARVLNFSMGKPRIGFNYNNGEVQDVNL